MGLFPWCDEHKRLPRGSAITGKAANIELSTMAQNESKIHPGVVNILSKIDPWSLLYTLWALTSGSRAPTSCPRRTQERSRSGPSAHERPKSPPRGQRLHKLVRAGSEMCGSPKTRVPEGGLEI